MTEPDVIDDVARPGAPFVAVVPEVDPEVVEADRQDVRRGVLVAAVGLVAVAVVGGLLNLGAGAVADKPEKLADSSEVSDSSDTSVQLPTFSLPEDDVTPTPTPSPSGVPQH